MILKIILVVIIAGLFAWFLVPEFKHAVIYWWIEYDYTGRTLVVLKTLQGILQNPLAAN